MSRPFTTSDLDALMLRVEGGTTTPDDARIVRAAMTGNTIVFVIGVLAGCLMMSGCAGLFWMIVR